VPPVSKSSKGTSKRGEHGREENPTYRQMGIREQLETSRKQAALKGKIVVEPKRDAKGNIVVVVKDPNGRLRQLIFSESAVSEIPFRGSLPKPPEKPKTIFQSILDFFVGTGKK